MAKVRTTVTLDEEVLRAVKVRAARAGKGDSQVIEEAVRRHLGLDLLQGLWARSDLSGEAAVDVALAAQHAARRRAGADVAPAGWRREPKATAGEGPGSQGDAEG